MARARNPRVLAVEILKDLKRNADNVRARWTPTGTVMETGEPTYREENGARIKVWGPTVWRKRRPEEYPETQSKEWVILWAHADDMEKQAAALKALALAEWQKFPGNAEYVMTRKADA